MKKFLRLAPLACCRDAVSAQPYPAKPIRVAVAFPPGGPVDIIARLLGPKLSSSLGQSVVVENVVGASGNLAAQRVARSAPDGYTVLAHSSAYAVNPALFASAGYDGGEGFRAIAIVASQPNFIVVHADFPAHTLAELMSRAKHREACLRLAAKRHHAASYRRESIPRARPGRHHARSVQGRRPGRRRSARRAAAHRLHRGLGTAAAHQGREAARARRIVGAPPAVASRRADAQRARLTGMEDYTWVGLFRSRRHAARRRAQAERSHRARGAEPGVPRAAGRPRLRGHRRAARRDCRLCAEASSPSGRRSCATPARSSTERGHSTFAPESLTIFAKRTTSREI